MNRTYKYRHKKAMREMTVERYERLARGLLALQELRELCGEESERKEGLIERVKRRIDIKRIFWRTDKDR